MVVAKLRAGVYADMEHQQRAPRLLQEDSPRRAQAVFAHQMVHDGWIEEKNRTAALDKGFLVTREVDEAGTEADDESQRQQSQASQVVLDPGAAEKKGKEEKSGDDENNDPAGVVHLQAKAQGDASEGKRKIAAGAQSIHEQKERKQVERPGIHVRGEPRKVNEGDVDRRDGDAQQRQTVTIKQAPQEQIEGQQAEQAGDHRGHVQAKEVIAKQGHRCGGGQVADHGDVGPAFMEDVILVAQDDFARLDAIRGHVAVKIVGDRLQAIDAQPKSRTQNHGQDEESAVRRLD